MKKIIFTSILFCLVAHVFSQVDTIYNKKHQKIACKITEINEYEIKYKLAGLEDGPVYVINKTTVQKYSLSNGFSEVITPDELSLENEHAEIVGNRSAIKIHPFSFVNNQFSFAYEKVIKVGMNLDIEAGYTNSNINNYGGFNGNPYQPFNSGMYVKPGVKFFLGQDYSVRGLKYAHPLKGRYIKLDLAVSYLNYQNLSAVQYSYTGNPYYNSYVVNTITSDLNVMSYGGFVNYGRQFILGNILTLEYYFGVGFTGITYSYSNNQVLNNTRPTNGSYYYSTNTDAKNLTNFHGFLRVPGVGLSFTGGFRIGYIIPEKIKKQVKKTVTE